MAHCDEWLGRRGSKLWQTVGWEQRTRIWRFLQRKPLTPPSWTHYHLMPRIFLRLLNRPLWPQSLIDPYRQVLYWTLGFYFLACHLYPVKFHQFCVEITYELLFMLGITSPHPKYNITNMYISHIFCFPPLWQLVILWVYQPCIKFCITGPLLCFPGEDVQQSSLSTKPSLWPHRSWTLFW